MCRLCGRTHVCSNDDLCSLTKIIVFDQIKFLIHKLLSCYSLMSVTSNNSCINFFSVFVPSSIQSFGPCMAKESSLAPRRHFLCSVQPFVFEVDFTLHNYGSIIEYINY